MKLYLRLLRLVKPHTPRFILAMLCMAVVGAATAAAAYLVKPAMDDIFLDRNEGMLILIPLAVIALYLLKGLCNYGQTVLMSH
ncbi:MAG TPA: ABC transporter permease, partial [Syntrophales bacterium]|nr:ABC transporter permease [Syntrophales bacterium]